MKPLMDELKRLKTSVDNLLAEHELVRHAFEEDAVALSNFLRSYYARVIPALEPGSSFDENELLFTPSDSRGRARRLYAELMKSHHPDNNDAIDAPAELLAEIQQAYRDVNILGLEQLLVRAELAKSTPHEQVNFLWKKSMAISETTAVIKRRHAEMRETPEYKLYRKNFEALEMGVDLAEAVVSNISTTL